VNKGDKPLIWFKSEIKTPPFSDKKRIEAGYYLRLLQNGHKLEMPHSKPLPDIGRGCHELRMKDKRTYWRIIYKVESDAILILDVFKKKTNKLSNKVIDRCTARIKLYKESIK